MKTGNLETHRSIVRLLAIFLLVLPGLQSLALTPDISCANDSLLLISPDALVLKQQISGRPGVTISWGDLGLEQATCYALTDVDGLDYGVSVEGGFGDQVDRQMVFDTIYSGEVGSTGPSTMLLTWVTEGPTTYGVLAGTINLANNGGIFQFSETTGLWEQKNLDLPMAWRQTNTSALDLGTNGFAIAGFSGGQVVESSPKGLFKYDGGRWSRFAEDLFTDSLTINWVSISPLNNDHFAVGTAGDGLYVTNDGGESFAQWGANLDPDFEPAPSTVNIKGLEWSPGKLWVFVPTFGLFSSSDNGGSFQRSNLLVEVDLDDPDTETTLPLRVNEIVTDPSDPDHVLVAMDDNGVFQSFDGGQTWSDTYGDLMVVDPDNAGAWIFSAASIMVDRANPDLMVVGMKNKGMYRTTDGGSTWVLVGADVSNESLGSLRAMNLIASDGPSGNYYCLQDDWSVLVSADQGITWAHLAEQPLLKKGTRLVLVGDSSGDFFMGSYGGGIYLERSPIVLSDTYNSSTTSGLRSLELGLDISFDIGNIVPGFQFRLKCQTFQGWSVWRAPSHTPDDMILIGNFDRVNPEACIEGYCGNVNFEIVPQCYNSKRAACFNFDTPDTIRFFDEEVFNGFSYHYAISSYDYGNTALSSPQNNSQIPVYSPRWNGDSLSPFSGNGNRTSFLLNEPSAPASGGEEIYVFPNPLRIDSGLPGQEGETVTFTNLPEGSRVRIFTTAGDDVINLGPDNLHGGNMFWRTRNRHDEQVSPGVYLYKVEMPQQEDYWGRLVIIR